MRSRTLITIAITVLLLAGAGWTAWRLAARHDASVCAACTRPVHRNMRTVAEVGGKRNVYCCPACAFSEAVQERNAAHFTELTDFDTGEAIAPRSAWIVRGSNLNPCMQAHSHEVMSPDKQPMQVEFDRCAPSLLAFGSRAEAEAFTRRHGGQILAFAAVEASYAPAGQ